MINDLVVFIPIVPPVSPVFLHSTGGGPMSSLQSYTIGSLFVLMALWIVCCTIGFIGMTFNKAWSLMLMAIPTVVMILALAVGLIIAALNIFFNS